MCIARVSSSFGSLYYITASNETLPVVVNVRDLSRYFGVHQAINGRQPPVMHHAETRRWLGCHPVILGKTTQPSANRRMMHYGRLPPVDGSMDSKVAAQISPVKTPQHRFRDWRHQQPATCQRTR
eukprot:7763115-Pyramimonas_sp.AAC.1